MRTSKEVVIDVEQEDFVRVRHLGSEISFCDGGISVLLSPHEPDLEVTVKGRREMVNISGFSETEDPGLYVWSQTGFTTVDDKGVKVN